MKVKLFNKTIELTFYPYQMFYQLEGGTDSFKTFSFHHIIISLHVENLTQIITVLI